MVTPLTLPPKPNPTAPANGEVTPGNKEQQQHQHHHAPSVKLHARLGLMAELLRLLSSSNKGMLPAGAQGEGQGVQDELRRIGMAEEAVLQVCASVCERVYV